MAEEVRLPVYSLIQMTAPPALLGEWIFAEVTLPSRDGPPGRKYQEGLRVRKKYLLEFKMEAVRLVHEQGMTHGEAGDDLAVCRTTIRDWVRKADLYEVGPQFSEHRRWHPCFGQRRWSFSPSAPSSTS
jgi:hypothetical protein